jgi:hypothetical protein
MAVRYGPKAGETKAFNDALATQRAAGITEFAAAAGAGGMNITKVVIAKEPAKLVNGITDMYRSLTATAARGPTNFTKSQAFDPQFTQFKGFKLIHVTVNVDIAKIAKLQPPAQGRNQNEHIARIAEGRGGDTSHTWYGTDGKVVVVVAAKNFDAAKTQLDALLGPQPVFGATAGYKAARARLPEVVAGLYLISGNGGARSLTNYFTATMGKEAPKLPPDLPKVDDYISASATPSGNTMYFEAIVPSTLGPVIDKGIVPLVKAAAKEVEDNPPDIGQGKGKIKDRLKPKK